MQGAPGLSGASDDEGILVGQPADVCALSVLYAPKAVAIYARTVPHLEDWRVTGAAKI